MDEEILPITALTEEEIIKNNYSLNQLWMISFQEKVQGPFLESQLKKIFIENKELKLKSFQFCNLEKEKWVSLENTNFLGTDKVYMIVNTSDQIKFDDIVKLVLEKEIDENILISSDEGSSYNSLRSLQEFQFLFSRIPKLPDLVSKEQFFHDKTLQIKINQKKMSTHLVENLINSNKTLTSQMKNIKLSTNSSNAYIASVLFFIFSITIGYNFLNKKQNLSSVKKINVDPIKTTVEKSRELTSVPQQEVKQNFSTSPEKEPSVIHSKKEYGIDGEPVVNEPASSNQSEQVISNPPVNNTGNQNTQTKAVNPPVEKTEMDMDDEIEE